MVALIPQTSRHHYVHLCMYCISLKELSSDWQNSPELELLLILTYRGFGVIGRLLDEQNRGSAEIVHN